LCGNYSGGRSFCIGVILLLLSYDSYGRGDKFNIQKQEKQSMKYFFRRVFLTIMVYALECSNSKLCKGHSSFVPEVW
jgi:hypothetical protein